eukprot:TRINITY_DN11837_c0_g1_i2.p1 TRINITY_DN11837_c0_g1~~TRINITY_DN11837_c0_g1_i2.p1  ORF type:complete len:202 (+),score=18.31 TRINITY_DN11837_c0_g1_i2:39-644(+)
MDLFVLPRLDKIRNHTRRAGLHVGPAGFLLLIFISVTSPESAQGDVDAAGEAEQPLRIVVLDGTWNRVKSMKRHLARLGCTFPHVRLDPSSLDYWTKRGNKSIYARTQTQPDRICTVEATALLLRELGETEENCDALIGYVELNNLRLKNALPQTAKKTTSATHRCFKGQCRTCRRRAAREGEQAVISVDETVSGTKAEDL